MNAVATGSWEWATGLVITYGRKHQRHASGFLSRSVCDKRNGIERKMVVVIISAAFLGLLSAALSFAAEAKRIKIGLFWKWVFFYAGISF
ncbi:hypothetical protein ACLOJK_030280 [Asimina triloba]